MKVQQVFKRYEKKYLMTVDQTEKLLAALENKMYLDEFGEHAICNIYFDTPDFELIRNSIEGPIYKEKLRLRSYGTPNDENTIVFVELKKKFNGIVYKRRYPMTLQEAEAYLYNGIHPDRDSQILRELDWFLKTNDVKPAVYLTYTRRAYIGIENPDFRLTLDKNIRCRRRALRLTEGSVGESIINDDLTLMEIKIPGCMPIWMSHILSELSIYPTSFSKYGTFYKQHSEMFEAALRECSARDISRDRQIININTAKRKPVRSSGF